MPYRLHAKQYLHEHPGHDGSLVEARLDLRTLRRVERVDHLEVSGPDPDTNRSTPRTDPPNEENHR